MKPQLTKAIILSRTDYGEADRIVTILTPDRGKLTLMARGVRKPKSKLAGGIELFSTSEITYITGRGEIGTLISARLQKHYGNIIKDITRVQLGYELIKTLHKSTEDELEDEYYSLLETGFQSLEDFGITVELIGLWFNAQLLSYSGHTPNLRTDTAGNKLEADKKYLFDFDAMTFTLQPDGPFGTDHIKLLRLAFSANPPQLLNKVEGIAQFLPDLTPLIQNMAQYYLRA